MLEEESLLVSSQKQALSRTQSPVNPSHRISGTSTSVINFYLYKKKKFRFSVRKAFVFLTPKMLKNPLVVLLSNPHQTLEAGKKIFSYIKEFVFFKQFFNAANINTQDENTIFYLCTKMQLEIFSKGDVIFEELQESNNKMYIVITGKIAIVINKPFNTFGHAPIKTEYSEIDYKRFGCKVNEVTCGEGFGEKALFAETKRQAVRSATCICLSEVSLISLDRDSFLEVIQQFKQGNKEKLEFLLSILPYFDKISSQQTIDNLMYSFKDEVRYHGSFITFEGDVGDTIYLLAQGEVNAYKYINGKDCLLGVICEKQIIGEELLLNEDDLFPTYQYTYQVVSMEVRLYRITIGSLKLRAPGECLSKLKDLYKQKLLHRLNQIQELQKSANQFNSQWTVKENDDLGNLNLFEKRQFVNGNQKQSDNQNQSTKYLKFAQRKAYLLSIKRKVLQDIIKILKVEVNNPAEQWEEKCMETIRKSWVYKLNTIRNFLEMDEDWIAQCNLEDLKEELLKIGSKSIQIFSLRNKANIKLLQMSKTKILICRRSQWSQQLERSTMKLEDKEEKLNINLDDQEIQKKSFFRLIQAGHLVLNPPRYSQNFLDRCDQLRNQNLKRKQRFTRNQKQYSRSIQSIFLLGNLSQPSLETDLPSKIKTERSKNKNSIMEDPFKLPSTNHTKTLSLGIIQKSVEQQTKQLYQTPSSVQLLLNEPPQTQRIQKLSFQNNFQLNSQRSKINNKQSQQINPFNNTKTMQSELKFFVSNLNLNKKKK